MFIRSTVSTRRASASSSWVLTATRASIDCAWTSGRIAIMVMKMELATSRDIKDKRIMLGVSFGGRTLLWFVFLDRSGIDPDANRRQQTGARLARPLCYRGHVYVTQNRRVSM